jgi:hypothetical protein
MKMLQPKFNPNRNVVMVVSLLVKLFGVPLEYLGPMMLTLINNYLGAFILVALETFPYIFTTCTKTCVYANLSKGLPSTMLACGDRN